MTNCKYWKIMEEQKIYINEFWKEINCMECGVKVRFGDTYNIECSETCAFYHKYVCANCSANASKEKIKNAYNNK